MAGIKLHNVRADKKEALPSSSTLATFLPLPPALHNLEGNLPLSQFPGVGAMRLYYFTLILNRALQASGQRLKLVDSPEQAALVIFGDPYLTPEADLAGQQARFGLKVEGIIFKGEGNQEALAVLSQYSPDEVQYLFFGTHYRQALLLSGAALNNARAALARLHDYAERFATEGSSGGAKKADLDVWRERFYQQLQDDLNVPRALAVLWTMLQSPLGPGDKLGLLAEFDRVLGLGLGLSAPVVATASPPSNGQHPARSPEKAKTKDREKPKNTPETEGGKAKEAWKQNKTKGKVITGVEGNAPPKPRPNQKPGKTPEPAPAPERRKIESTRQVRSFLNETDRFDFTVSLLAHNNLTELRPTIESLLFYTTRGSRKVEIIAVDLGSQDGSTEYLDSVAASYANFRVMLASSQLGEAAGRNLTFRQGRGRYLLLLDAGLTLVGDLFEALANLIEKDERPALYGLYPLRLKRGPDNKVTGFEPQPVKEKESRVEVEALEGSLLCLRRAQVEEAGFMDERFRLPYALDLDYSFAFHDKGFKVIALPGLARFVNKPSGFSRPNYGLPTEELERQRQKNWQLFLKSWQL